MVLHAVPGAPPGMIPGIRCGWIKDGVGVALIVVV